MTEDAIGYAAALRELEEILAELERDPTDVDRLGAQVARAAELIRVCRDRIGRARLEVEHIVAELEAAAPAEPSTGLDEPGDAS